MFESMPNTEPKNTKRVHVAVGVIVDSDQRILIALRPGHVHQGGLWEFPGGKVEAAEAVEQALARELFEELGLELNSCRPLTQVCHDYGDKSVLLDVYWVEGFSGQAEGREGQPIAWVKAAALLDYPFPAANQRIISAVQRALLPELIR
jgi:8-oxo-dGTP diphosphatase